MKLFSEKLILSVLKDILAVYHNQTFETSISMFHKHNELLEYVATMHILEAVLLKKTIQNKHEAGKEEGKRAIKNNKKL